MPLLSIAIPAYNRKKELKHCLEVFVSQISGRYEELVEIIVSDDCSPNEALAEVKAYTCDYPFIKFRRYDENIGLEKNLLCCSDICTGKYLWIFGDDDFLEFKDSLSTILELLKLGEFDFYVLNRTRRSFDLNTVITDNWMKLDVNSNYEYPGLKDFCLQYGFISIIGFISVNIFRREYFQSVDATKYFGTMYPQLGAMLEAFYNKKTLLVGKPLVCHRTQSAEEKKKALGDKKSESSFMADVKVRNATYFSHPYVHMMNSLVNCGAFKLNEILKIPENTVINGLLIDFLINCVKDSHSLSIGFSHEDWIKTLGFFDKLGLDSEQTVSLGELFNLYIQSQDSTKNGYTISVITPSYNQSSYLDKCLLSVLNQTYKPIEQLVFDPGSSDGSVQIAASYPHVTLFHEDDEGQSDAINKGFVRAKGDIIAWVNSDDFFYDSSVFEKVIERFEQSDSPDIVYGKGVFYGAGGEKLRDVYVNKKPETLEWRFQHEDGILQPALFMKKSVIEKVGKLRKDRHFCMDYEYWIRCVKAGMHFAFLDDYLAGAVFHTDNKTLGMRDKSFFDVCDMLMEHFGYVNHVWLRRYAEFITEGNDGVLAHSGNRTVKDKKKLDQEYQRLLIIYNTSYDTFQKLLGKPSVKGFGDTLREMKSLGIKPSTPCEEVPLDMEYIKGKVCYTVATRRFAFDANWKQQQINKAHDFLRQQIAVRSSDVCVIVGNGPSLNKVDFSLLNECDVIISNNAFLDPRLLSCAKYLTVVNYLVAEQNSHIFNQLEGVSKVVPYWLSYCLNASDDTFFVDAVGYPEFSSNIFKNMSWRHTVTFFNMHLAYGLGYKKVILIGFDHSYIQPKVAQEQDVLIDFEDDVNHFHPDYFRGKNWQAADVGMMEEMYSLAKEAFEEDNREIVNATEGGHLELFRRESLENALKSPEEVNDGILLGPFEREQHAHFDETDLIAALFRAGVFRGKSMIDVGAHEGYALAPFMEMGWCIQAFEPDEVNREKLLQRVSNSPNGKNVSVDVRCVNDESQVGLSFYRSEQSTGISGLSAFHETHEEAQKVDSTSLSDFYLDNEMDLEVDFLKIDTEGHDLFVLKGFPWDRCKPLVIECEFEDSKTVSLGYNLYDLADYLVERGYLVYVSEWHPIIRYGIRHDWKCWLRYPCKIGHSTAWGNLIAFRETIDESVLEVFLKKIVQVKPPSSLDKSTPIMPITEKDYRSYSVAYSGNVVYTGGRVWSSPKQTSERRYICVSQDLDCNQQLGVICGVKLKSNRDVSLRLSVCRNGLEQYQGYSQELSLSADEECVYLMSNIFNGEFSSFRSQIDLLDDESIELYFEVFGFEGVSPPSDLSFIRANELYRQGDFKSAMLIYLELLKRNDFEHYMNNAKFSAAKLWLC